MSAAPRCLLFTDLDGTLLDWDTYSPAVARPAMQRLIAAGVQIVFCSSKTATEQRALCAEVGLPGIWAIVENGAAIIAPENAALVNASEWVPDEHDADRAVRVLGMRRGEILQRLEPVGQRVGLKLHGYAGITDAELAAMTGLTIAAAARARQRDFSETLIDELPEPIWQQLEPEFAAQGLDCRHGGRFRTVTGAGTDKGAAVTWLAAQCGAAMRTIGIGDSANDWPMLRAVQEAYVVARPDGTWTKLDLANAQYLSGAGPAGWVQMADRVLASLQTR
ncbi:MAG: HAD-IIB family hydrolase [Cephaloticoccus sp.]|nr:HAD-IIB family hydrolase [Cephaloticoccus sp.]